MSPQDQNAYSSPQGQDAYLSPQDQDASNQPALKVLRMQNYETMRLFRGHTIVYSTMYLFHLYLYLFHGHTTQFGDQLMERLLDAIMWSGYMVWTAQWCILYALNTKQTPPDH